MPIARYVQRRKDSEGKYRYFFTPPPELVAAKVVYPEPLGTHREHARLRAMHLNNKIDEWRASEKQLKVIIKGTVDELFHRYLNSRYYLLQLSTSARNEYGYWIKRVAELEVDKRRFGGMLLSDLKHSHGEWIYDYYIANGSIAQGFRCVTVLRRVFNLGIRWDMVQVNPFTMLEVRTPESRSEVWQQDQVDSFCKAAIAAGRKSMAEMMQLAYETSQRRKDLLKLRKRDFNPETGILTIKQSKTENEVYIPIRQEFHYLFDRLSHPYSFVFVNEQTGDPYTDRRFNKVFNEIRELAGLPDNLQFRDIRRTVLTELGNLGASEDEIMAISGHTSRSMLNTYVRKTAKQAGNAVNRLAEYRSKANADNGN